VIASINALADIGDAESAAAIRKFLNSSPRPVFYFTAKDAIARIKPESDSESLKMLRTSVEEMREKLSKLQEQFNSANGSAKEEKNN